jgi:hypothetical protein
MKKNNRKGMVITAIACFGILLAIYAFYISKHQVGNSKAVANSAPKTFPNYPEQRDSSNFSPGHFKNSNENQLQGGVATQLIVATTLIVLFALFLYSRQRRLDSQLKSPHIITPQDFESFINQLGSRAEKLEIASLSNSREISLVKSELLNSYQEMRETFLTMQSALDQRDSEIKRLQNGSEINITKRFLKRFAKIDQFIDQNLRSGNSLNLSQVSTLLRDALEESDVYIHEPEVSTDYRQDKSITEKPIVFLTDDPSQYYKIKSVKSHGYQVRTDSGAVINIIEPIIEVYAPRGVEK